MSTAYDKFRGHVKRETEQARKKKGGGKSFASDRFNLEPDDEADVRFLEPIGDFFTKHYHWPFGGKPSICTSEHVDFEGKCVTCFYHAEQREEQKKLKNANPNHQWVASKLGDKRETLMEIIDFRYYHKIPNPDAKGDNDRFLEEPCRDKETPSNHNLDDSGCEHCLAGGDSAVRVFGGKREWSLRTNERELDAMLDAHKKLNAKCIHTDEKGRVCGKTIKTERIACRKCDADLYDSRAVRTMKPAPLAQICDNTMKCGNCGEVDLPVMVGICGKGEHDVVRGSIFDQKMKITCFGTEKDGINGGNSYIEKRFNAEPASSDLTTVDEDLQEAEVPEEEAEKIITPWDFHHRNRPEYVNKSAYLVEGTNEVDMEKYRQAVWAKQAEKLGKPNPFAAVADSRSGFSPKNKRSFGQK